MIKISANTYTHLNAAEVKSLRAACRAMGGGSNFRHYAARPVPAREVIAIWDENTPEGFLTIMRRKAQAELEALPEVKTLLDWDPSR